MAAQGIVAGIRQGCELLSQGKQEITKLKKTVEGGVADAKAIYSEVAGLWSWVKGLFGGNTAAKPTAKSAVTVESKSATKINYKPKPAEQLTYEEYQTKQSTKSVSSSSSSLKSDDSSSSTATSSKKKAKPRQTSKGRR